MKILLVGNLPEDRQESMLRFETMMTKGLQSRGHEVVNGSPLLRLSRLLPSYRYGGLPKYVGYLDKFVLHPRRLANLVASKRPDVLHVVDHANACYACPGSFRASLVTCHDLQQVRVARGEIPGQGMSRGARVMQHWILRNIRRAPLVACVSANTAEDLRRIAGLPDSRIRTIPNALNFPYHRLPLNMARAEAARLRCSNGAPLPDLSEGFLLNVGGGHWYKNRPGMLKIFQLVNEQLPRRLPLLMVGSALSEEDARLVADLGLQGSFYHLEGINNEGLQALYSLATGLLFPSWEEGFGWPIAEAQSCGCPVFTSNRRPMSDVGGRSAILIDPASPQKSAEIILEHWQELKPRATLGLEEARRWESTAMLDLYEQAYADLIA